MHLIVIREEALKALKTSSQFSASSLYRVGWKLRDSTRQRARGSSVVLGVPGLKT